MQLAESLKGNKSLKVLDIGGNNIGPEGIKVLLEALRGNDTLRNLELGYNPIGEEGAKHLADVIKYDLAVSAACQKLGPYTTPAPFPPITTPPRRLPHTHTYMHARACAKVQTMFAHQGFCRTHACMKYLCIKDSGALLA